MKKILEIIGWLSGLTSLISVICGLLWFFFTLNNRIGTLESQMQAIYQSSSTGSQNLVKNNDKNSKSSSNIELSDNKMQNIIETCSTLALRVASAYEKGSPLTVAEPLEKMMDKLGCNKIQN